MTDDETRPYPSNPNYRLYRDGRVESRYRHGHGGGVGDEWRPVKHSIKYGYPCFYPKLGERAKGRFIHIAVMESWVGPCPPGMLCRHKDDNKLNCHLDNLVWGTPTENNQDSIRNGKRRTGTRHPQSVLSDEQVRDVLLARRYRMTIADIAEALGVAQSTVGRYLKLAVHAA